MVNTHTSSTIHQSPKKLPSVWASLSNLIDVTQEQRRQPANLSLIVKPAFQNEPMPKQFNFHSVIFKKYTPHPFLFQKARGWFPRYKAKTIAR
jgi:hypothetical protein